jgi:hypothetical protein
MSLEIKRTYVDAFRYPAISITVLLDVNASRITVRPFSRIIQVAKSSIPARLRSKELSFFVTLMLYNLFIYGTIPHIGLFR